jgi:Flp pilus assembly protein TadB
MQDKQWCLKIFKRKKFSLEYSEWKFLNRESNMMTYKTKRRKNKSITNKYTPQKMLKQVIFTFICLFIIVCMCVCVHVYVCMCVCVFVCVCVFYIHVIMSMWKSENILRKLIPPFAI